MQNTYRMARKHGKKGELPTNSVYQRATLREENTGKKHVNASSMLKMQHLQNLATWASGEASIPCLGALFGRRLAANAEDAGVPLDRSLILCQRCETILHPGDNCTVRIEKKSTNRRHPKNSHLPTKNNVVYTCHFCSHRNLMMGSMKGGVKELLALRSRNASGSETQASTETKSSKGNTAGKTESRSSANGDVSLCLTLNPISEFKGTRAKKEVVNNRLAVKESPLTPCSVNLEKRRKMDGPGSSKVATGGQSSVTTEAGMSAGGSSKRRRKGWSSLKEIVESSENASNCNMSNLVIPFKL